MRTNDFYNDVLIRPFTEGANELLIVSGYASATFAYEHLETLKKLVTDDLSCKINLIIGMPGKRNDHPGFLKLRDQFTNNFYCYYLEETPPVHSKVFTWLRDGEPYRGYAGSANYSKPGFESSDQINQISEEDPYQIKEFYESLITRATAVENYVGFRVEDVTEGGIGTIAGSLNPGKILWEIPDKRVRISFLARNGSLPQRSGLNWGQRPEEGREPNQAYLSIKATARKEGFLPPIARPFTLITDDNNSIDCVVAQQGRKAIHSTYDNSELGVYVRNRLGVELGAPVTLQHLEDYGRTDFVIEKINDDTFLFDFSTVRKVPRH